MKFSVKERSLHKDPVAFSNKIFYAREGIHLVKIAVIGVSAKEIKRRKGKTERDRINKQRRLKQNA